MSADVPAPPPGQDEPSLMQKLLKFRTRLSGQFVLGIGGAVALTVAASVVAWLFLDRVASVQRRVNEGSVPEMVAAFGVAQHAGNLVAAAPRLTTAATPGEFAAAADRINDTHQALQDELDALRQAGADPAAIAYVRTRADTLLSNIEAIGIGMTELFPLAERSAGLRAELAALRGSLDELVVPAIDDQLFYTITGYHTLGRPPAARSEHLSERELGRYRRLADLQADGSIASQLLASAFNLQDASSIEPLRERFESAAGRIERSLAALEESPLRAEVVPIFARLLALGLGEGSGFDLRTRELRLAGRQRELLARNRDLTVELVAEVDELVDTAHARTRAATQASTQAIRAARTLLLLISAISLVGAVLIAWLFIGRVLLHRLGLLSDWMRRMAGGDLEARVEIGGRDEVADMAAALEVFRRHALEVQRLNLVERLAQELQGKNEELEKALEDLGRAQDQIVMREKLAALGELTAGVAHEIRNPLNFVKNFSEASEELIEELGEVLEEAGGKLDDEQTSLLAEITGDLVGNLKRIRSHGDRANRIVHDMLMMGRHSSEVLKVEINALLEEYARLAYHSARATDPEFQLDVQYDLDPEMGEMEVIPQDLGRVFLNMVANACDATDDKRRAGAGSAANGDPYQPALHISSRRDAERAVIRIKDNADGMPPELVAKIFTPFFTTKPAGKGTGLGLAMSADIVREHGGTIEVNTEPGAFTEMVIDLPLQPPAKLGAADEKA